MNTKKGPRTAAEIASRAEDGRKAMAEHETRVAAIDGNVARQRAARLAREAELAAAAPPPAPARRSRAKPKVS